MNEKMATLLDNYNAFYLMVKTVAMLGTKNSEEFDRDALLLIYFIGKAYHWDQEKIDYAAEIILGEMMRVGLASDYLALASTNLLDADIKKNMLLYEIKGRAIEEVNRAEIIGGGLEQRIEYEIKNSMGYTSFHHEYEPRFRFAQIDKLSENGEITALFEKALMLILGIGCVSDIVSAQRILQNLLIWDEKSASLILSFLWEREGDKNMQTYYSDIYDRLSRNEYIEDVQKDDKIEEIYLLISSIQSFIVKNYRAKEVDMLFADLINSDEIDFQKKMDIIRQYKDGNWLNILVNHKPKHTIGFSKQK